jgi:hypothetical protein
LTIDPEVSNAWQRLTSDASEVNWFISGYPEGKNNLLEVRIILGIG